MAMLARDEVRLSQHSTNGTISRASKVQETWGEVVKLYRCIHCPPPPPPPPPPAIPMQHLHEGGPNGYTNTVLQLEGDEGMRRRGDEEG